MTTDSKLKSDWVSEKELRVSWIDVKRRERTFANQVALVIGILGSFILGSVILFNTGNIVIFLVLVIGSIVGFALYGRSYEEPNSVTFGEKETTHRGSRFPTDKITRFEMGSEMALEGGVSTKPFIGGQGKDHEANQTIIRLWVEDMSAHNITRNNWQSQVNHEIHGALTKALEAVRNLKKQQEHAKEFGTVGDDGMPDY